MRDLAAHMADMVRNALDAEAKTIDIRIKNGSRRLLFSVIDDGCGMDAAEVKRAVSPFFSSKAKDFGFGLALLKTSAEETGGFLRLSSKKDRGTKVKAVFFKTHPDCKPMGNIPEVILALMQSSPETEIRFTWRSGNRCVRIESRQLREYKEGKILISPFKAAAAEEFLKQIYKQKGQSV